MYSKCIQNVFKNGNQKTFKAIKKIYNLIH